MAGLGTKPPVIALSQDAKDLLMTRLKSTQYCHSFPLHCSSSLESLHDLDEYCRRAYGAVS
jgi:hypothetical protein